MTIFRRKYEKTKCKIFVLHEQRVQFLLELFQQSTIKKLPEEKVSTKNVLILPIEIVAYRRWIKETLLRFLVGQSLCLNSMEI